jgi:uncharacterized membrane protein
MEENSMKYCPQCGAQVEDNSVFCPTCGYQFDVSQAPYTASKTTDTNNDQDASSNRAFGILSYIGFLVFVSIFGAKESPFAKFHANQGLWLFIGEVSISVLSSILQYIPFLRWFSWVLSPLWVVFVVFTILGIISAAKGEKRELPLIGKLPKLIK